MEHYLINGFGPDKAGIVEEISDIILKCGYNIEDSRMAILGDHFSVLLLVYGDPLKASELLKGLSEMTKLEIHLKPVKHRITPLQSLRYSIKMVGEDSKGIVHATTAFLKDNGVNISSLESWLTHAPHSGTEIFNLHTEIEVPANIKLRDLKQGLEKIGDQFNLDLDIEAVH